MEDLELTFALKEEIGNTALFVGRAEELAYFLKLMRKACGMSTSSKTAKMTGFLPQIFFQYCLFPPFFS